MSASLCLVRLNFQLLESIYNIARLQIRGFVNLDADSQIYKYNALNLEQRLDLTQQGSNQSSRSVYLRIVEKSGGLMTTHNAC
jgi:hypothetical protein